MRISLGGTAPAGAATRIVSSAPSTTPSRILAHRKPPSSLTFAMGRVAVAPRGASENRRRVYRAVGPPATAVREGRTDDEAPGGRKGRRAPARAVACVRRRAELPEVSLRRTLLRSSAVSMRRDRAAGFSLSRRGCRCCGGAPAARAAADAAEEAGELLPDFGASAVRAHAVLVLQEPLPEDLEVVPARVTDQIVRSHDPPSRWWTTYPGGYYTRACGGAQTLPGQSKLDRPPHAGRDAGLKHEKGMA